MLSQQVWASAQWTTPQGCEDVKESCVWYEETFDQKSSAPVIGNFSSSLVFHFYTVRQYKIPFSFKKDQTYTPALDQRNPILRE